MDYCQTPIFASYLACMRAAKQRSTRVQFQADRANMHWIPEELGRMFCQAHNTQVLRRLKLLQGLRRDSATGSPAMSLQQAQNLAAFWRLTVCTAGERAWHLLHHTYTLPEGFAGLVSENEEESLQCLARLRQMGELIMGAEEALRDENHGDRVVP